MSLHTVMLSISISLLVIGFALTLAAPSKEKNYDRWRRSRLTERAMVVLFLGAALLFLVQAGVF